MGWGKAKGGAFPAASGPYGLMGMAGGKGKGGAAGGGTSGGCKWCAMGECWGCPQQRGGGSLAAVEGIPPATELHVDGFCSMYAIQDHGIQKLKSLDPRLQTIIISKPGMEEARDATGMLMGRIKAVSTMKHDDWICRSCMDHQFAKNETCRSCGAAKQ
eukprot:gnl/TRDRNA2_/TRDRNA2_184226_c0_seq1.p1 gnl/TRDRNA2_/TRDRNA2_184226_c0~~gnl/TRDRNA2_/TRDRNA2_184226_c0_seq1.p1  ORF type:complete len:159 (+),score=27.61 gnl/TRDRNA2_/TRDRNA2_184226_c0_seq1:85-561(+)